VRVACCEKSHLEGTSETPFPAALSVPVALLRRVGKTWRRSRGRPPEPLFLARPGRCVWRLRQSKGGVCVSSVRAALPWPTTPVDPRFYEAHLTRPQWQPFGSSSSAPPPCCLTYSNKAPRRWGRMSCVRADNVSGADAALPSPL
jgi:hypothetical protein